MTDTIKKILPFLLICGCSLIEVQSEDELAKIRSSLVAEHAKLMQKLQQDVAEAFELSQVRRICELRNQFLQDVQRLCRVGRAHKIPARNCEAVFAEPDEDCSKVVDFRPYSGPQMSSPEYW